MRIIIALLAVVSVCAVVSTATLLVRSDRGATLDLVVSLATELTQERTTLRATIVNANTEIAKANAEIEKANAENARLTTELAALKR